MYDEWDDVLSQIEKLYGDKIRNEIDKLIDDDVFKANYLISYYLTSKVV